MPSLFSHKERTAHMTKLILAVLWLARNFRPVHPTQKYSFRYACAWIGRRRRKFYGRMNKNLLKSKFVFRIERNEKKSWTNILKLNPFYAFKKLDLDSVILRPENHGSNSGVGYAHESKNETRTTTHDLSLFVMTLKLCQFIFLYDRYICQIGMHALRKLVTKTFKYWLPLFYKEALVLVCAGILESFGNETLFVPVLIYLISNIKWCRHEIFISDIF